MTRLEEVIAEAMCDVVHPHGPCEVSTLMAPAAAVAARDWFIHYITLHASAETVDEVTRLIVKE